MQERRSIKLLTTKEHTYLIPVHCDHFFMVKVEFDPMVWAEASLGIMKWNSLLKEKSLKQRLHIYIGDLIT